MNWLARTAAAAIAALVAILLVDYAVATRRVPRDDRLIKDLQQQTKVDAAFAPKLAAEQNRVTVVRLDRKRRDKVVAWALIVAAAVFIASSKRLMGRTAVPSAPIRDVPRAPGDRKRAIAAIQPQAPPPLDLGFVDAAVARLGRGKESAIPLLQAIQAHYRYLPDEALRRVCELTEITPAEISGTSSFYSRFRRSPAGEHVVRVCHGTACHVSGARQITDELRRYLAIPDGADTDLERRFTLDEVACLGCCSLAPVLIVDSHTAGKLTPATACEALQAFERQMGATPASMKIRRGLVPEGTGITVHDEGAGSLWAVRLGTVEPVPDALEASRLSRLMRGAVEIRVGLASCGVASGAEPVRDVLEREARQAGALGLVKKVGCNGMCHREPIVEVVEADGRTALYGNVTTEAARLIARRHIRPRHFHTRVRWGIESLRAPALETPPDRNGSPYLSKQRRIVLENCGEIDPLDTGAYAARGGYEALALCLAGGASRRLSPERVIAAISDSGLRGRGGAGFPTGRKWALGRAQPGTVKYVICNGDEGDPGAFMDRLVLESDPHRVLEGLAIAAYAIGAAEGYLYIRAEYPVALRHVREAIRQAEQHGFLGAGILGSDFSLRLEVREGAGAFVCGEETALILSLEGKRGMPKLRPPYPVERGFRGRPTVINNVETLACVPWIIRHGAEAFAACGTETSKGTKVFSLAGKINRGGLIEVPMGITIREMVEDIGGGIKNGRRFKAVQLGGPSGGCIPERLADTPVDYEALARTGAIMGSGGLVVMDDRDCMVEIARFFLKFTQAESCGKCTFCRIGTKRMLEILERLCGGTGRRDDLQKLEELADYVSRASLCGLGQTAPNPVLTTLRYFRDEYEAHLDGRCPAGRCPALIRYRITDNCIGCTLCAQACPAGAITDRPYEKHEVDDKLCTRCDMCRQACQDDAVEVV